jgi:uncharacterized protein YndB with AHSA1/START domain
MATKSDTESVERVIAAPPEAIFALIADAAKHQEIDGSGSVRGTNTASEPLMLGSTFGMSMKLGLPYTTTNTVIEFEPDRLIAWQTQAPKPMSKLIGGRIWRYELEPVDGGTRVRETWDITQEKHKGGASMMRGRTITAMTKTLQRIDELLAQ